MIAHQKPRHAWLLCLLLTAKPVPTSQTPLASRVAFSLTMAEEQMCKQNCSVPTQKAKESSSKYKLVISFFPWQFNLGIGESLSFRNEIKLLAQDIEVKYSLQ